MAFDAYSVKFVVGDPGTAGAFQLHVAAVVAVSARRIGGHAQITQAIEPPNDRIEISDVTGHIHSLGFGENVRIVSLAGTSHYSFPPPAIGMGTLPFSATLVLKSEEWAGQGSFSYGGHHVEDVPVKLEAD